MSAPRYNYFKEALTGESRWWSWIMVSWFTVLGWLFVQIPITGPIPEVARAADPELGAEIDRATEAMLAGMDAKVVGLALLVFVVATLIGGISWLINRNTKGSTQTIFAVLTGLGVVGSIIGLWKLMGAMNDPAANASLMKAIGVSPVAYMLFLLVFPFSLTALYLGQKFLHKRTILSLHTSAKKIRWSRGLQAFFITWIVLGAFTAIGHFTGLSPINTKNKWIAFIITSILFAAMHLSNPEALKGAEEGILLLTMSSYFFFGFIACIMVWMDDGLESAIGFHAANNCFAAIFVNYEGSVLPTPSLFMATPNTVIDVPTTLLAMCVIASILYKTRKPLDMTFA